MSRYGNLLNDTSQRKALEALLNGTNELPANALGPGSVPRLVADELQDLGVPVTRFGADPTGATDSSTAIAAALNSGEPLLIFPRGANFLMAASAVRTVTSPVRLLMTGATLTLADGAIVNSDGDYDQHVCMLDFRGPDLLEIIGGTFDGNRSGQTYPATATGILLGSGGNGYRDNGMVRVTARSSSVGGGKVRISGTLFKESYLNGLALIEVDDADIEATFEDCTWNGLAFSSCEKVVVRDGSRFKRCGVSTQWPVEKMPGGSDRAGIQCRGRSALWTEETQGYPVLSGDPRPNGVVKVGAVVAEDCAIEGLYFRAVRTLRITGATAIDPGNSVADGYAFKPAGIWYEWAVDAKLTDCTVEMTDLPGGQDQPDGFVCFNMEDDDGTTTGGDTVPLAGPGRGELTNCHVKFRRALGGSTTRAFERGFRVNQWTKLRGCSAFDVDGPGLYASNSASFVAGRITGLDVDGFETGNCRAIAELTQHSGGEGVAGAAQASLRNLRFANMWDDGVGAEDRILIKTPSTWNAVSVDIEIAGLCGDATNAVGSGNNFIGARIRGDNTSMIDMHGWKVQNTYEAAQVYNFNYCRFARSRVEGGRTTVDHLASTGQANSGTLVIEDIDSLNLTTAGIVLSPATYTLDRLILQKLRLVSSSAVGILSGYNPTYHLALSAGEDVQAFGSHSLPATLQRSVAADAGNAALTLTTWSPRYQRFNTAITADRAVTLPSSGVKNGDWFSIYRTENATGAFNVNVGSGPLVALNAVKMGCIVRHNGSAWMLWSVWTNP